MPPCHLCQLHDNQIEPKIVDTVLKPIRDSVTLTNTSRSPRAAGNGSHFTSSRLEANDLPQQSLPYRARPPKHFVKSPVNEYQQARRRRGHSAVEERVKKRGRDVGQGSGGACAGVNHTGLGLGLG